MDSSAWDLEVPASVRARIGAPGEEHEALAREAGVFGRLARGDHRARRPVPADADPVVRVGAWNAERCKFPRSSLRLLGDAGCDLLMLTELDVGMARSGNVNAVEVLASGLGSAYAFGVEFVEGGAGNQNELDMYADEVNAKGLHGHAVLSGGGIRQARWLPTVSWGDWYAKTWHSPRLGGRGALAADAVVGTDEVLVVTLHLESDSSPEQRADEVGVALDQLAVADGRPVVVGGDLNTALMPREGEPAFEQGLWVRDAATYEPLFDVLAQHGFSWRSANTAEVTRRTLASGWPPPPHQRSDWLAVRGAEVVGAARQPALNSRGYPISDHDLITVDLRL